MKKAIPQKTRQITEALPLSPEEIKDAIYGENIAQILHLKRKSNGRYSTGWGDKTALGLWRTVSRFINDPKGSFGIE